jgi:uncharacterized protein (DUF58 family)
MPVNPAIQFLSPALLRSIASYELKARIMVDGMYASRHRCPAYGYSVEFVDHREYTRGDEPRTIDWKMLARTEKYFVKRFEMESNMNVACLLDISGSMGYRSNSTERLTKLEYGCYLAAGLCYLASSQQDSPGLVSFDQDIRDFLPPRQGQRHLFSILSRLQQAKSGGATNVASVLKLAVQRLHRRGIIVLISDCHGETEEVVDGFRHLVARGQELVVFQLLDQDEIDFPFDSLTAFRDAESGAEVMCDPVRQRARYLERFDEFQAGVKQGCVSCGADYRRVSTVEPVETVLRDYLQFRRERAR